MQQLPLGTRRMINPDLSVLTFLDKYERYSIIYLTIISHSPLIRDDKEVDTSAG